MNRKTAVFAPHEKQKGPSPGRSKDRGWAPESRSRWPELGLEGCMGHWQGDQGPRTMAGGVGDRNGPRSRNENGNG